jgi:hypothetical protein
VCFKVAFGTPPPCLQRTNICEGDVRGKKRSKHGGNTKTVFGEPVEPAPLTMKR